MAADVFLADAARRTGQPILRLYTWDKPTLSLGFHQTVSDEALNRCSRWGIPVVRRPTGGRAVLHDRELTYCIAIPSDHPLSAKRWGDLLQSIGRIFVEAAIGIGLKAELVRAGTSGSEPHSPRKSSPLCFDSLSRWEVRLEGCKWIGSAQRFLPGVLLQHGSILLGESDIRVTSLFHLQGRSAGEEPGFSKWRFLEGGEPTSEEALRTAIPQTFDQRWNLDWRDEPLSATEVEAIFRSARDYVIVESIEAESITQLYSQITEGK